MYFQAVTLWIPAACAAFVALHLKAKKCRMNSSCFGSSGVSGPGVVSARGLPPFVR